jgi:Rieske Fe-S protein
MGAAALTLAACAAPAEPEAAPSATGEGHEVMAASELKVGAQASVKINKADVIVYRQDESTVLAYSAICTHAGCTVVPGEDAKFHCPCHDSYFNVADGSVAGGPAPRPLTRFAATIEGDKVLVYL